MTPEAARAALRALCAGAGPGAGGAAGDDLPLDRGALLIAAEEDPRLDPDASLRALDDLGARVAARVGPAAPPLAQAAALRDVLAGEHGLLGDALDYHDPRNSLLHEVLARRRGLPITLSIVWVEVARRADLPFVGVAFPGHYLVRHREAELVLDPFSGGLTLDRPALRGLLERVGVPQPGDLGTLLAPARARPTLARVARNLVQAHLRRRDDARALRAAERVVLLAPAEPDARRDRGLLRLRAGDLRGAGRDLVGYLRAAPDAPDAPTVRTAVGLAARRLAELG